MRDLRHGFRALWRAPRAGAAARAPRSPSASAPPRPSSASSHRDAGAATLPGPARIVTVWETNRGGARKTSSPWPTSSPGASARGRSTTRHDRPANRLTWSSTASRTWCTGFAFSSDVFRASLIQPALGRGCTAEEDHGGKPVIVLGHEFWQRRLGHPDVLGLTLKTGDSHGRSSASCPRASPSSGQKPST